ncbi:FGGY family carbohydrate kinase, partial [Parabacteroides distasonis]
MIDLVNASMLGLYETTTQSGWSEQLLSEFHINPDWLPEIHIPGTLYGTLLPEIARKLGVRPGIPVAVGTNDVASAQMGAHNLKSGQMMNTAGSSEMISILTDRPVPSPHYYLRNAAVPGLWQIYATTAGGFALDWFYRQFCREMPQEEFYTYYLEKALETVTTPSGISFAPYLTGDRQSLTPKTGSWQGLTLSATREEMLCAMLKSMQG